MQALSFTVSEAWKDQSLSDAIRWHKATMPKITDLQIEAFKAGYLQAWRDALSTLDLQGYLARK